MTAVIEHLRGYITDYDEKRKELVIRVPYDNFPTLVRREYREVEVQPIDSRPLSDKQRRSCYAMIREISNWSGMDADEIKDTMKFNFIASLVEDMDTFSLSNARMSVVAAFQSFLARFIVSHDVPTKKPMLEYVDDIADYVYACLINKKCPICGKHADLHHVDAIGMGRDREQIIHEGLEVLPLCRVHHNEIHSMGKQAFFKRYHITGGIEADRTICKIYGLKRRKT